LSQDAEVGVKWKVQRGWRADHACGYRRSRPCIPIWSRPPVPIWSRPGFRRDVGHVAVRSRGSYWWCLRLADWSRGWCW